MKYKLIGNNDFIMNPIKTVLNNRGIEDIDTFLNPDEKVLNHWSALNNIDNAVKCLLGHLHSRSEIFIQIDSDVDGLSSSAIIFNYLKKIDSNSKVTWRLQEGKQHGIILDQIPENTRLVIVPDAGSNQYEEHSALKQKGIEVLVLDHHLCEHESKDAIVVNNQLSPKYHNKNLSGAGIVYKFCQALDHHLGVNYADDFLDLVSLGNIADMMDTRELETRYYILNGLKRIKNTFLKTLIEKQSYSMKNTVSPVSVAFYIVPLLNAAIRVGTQEEKENVFKSLIGSTETIYYKRNDEFESIQVNTARQLTNIKRRQDKLRDEGVGKIHERVKEKQLDKNKFLIVNVSDCLDKELTGLVANQLVSVYKRPVLLIRESQDKEGVFGGSARGYEKSPIKDLRQFLLSLGTFNFCEGHANAHGVEINADKLIETNHTINDLLRDVELSDDTYDVDFIIKGQQVNESLVKSIANLKGIWGQGVKEPLIAIEDLEVQKVDINLHKSVLKFKYKNIEFIKFKSSEEEISSLIDLNGNGVRFNLVGRFDLNIWNGNEIAQVVIDDYVCKGIRLLSF